MRLVIDFTRGAAGVPPELIAALEAEQARNHELAETVGRMHNALGQQNELLRTKQIELEHYKEDGHLWGLVVAEWVEREGGELTLLAGDVNSHEGKSVDAAVNAGVVTITVSERLEASDEGRAE